MTDTDTFLLRSIALAGGPAAWARDTCAAAGVPPDPAAGRFASVWITLRDDAARLQLGAVFVASVDAYHGPRVPVSWEAKERIVMAARAALSVGGDA